MSSTTIAKIKRAHGVRFKAIIRAADGHFLKSKTFTKSTNAREWARRIASDREAVEALGTEAARLTLREVVEGDPPQRNPMVVPDERRWQVDWWLDRLGDKQITDIRPDDVRGALNEYAHGNVQVFLRGSKKLKDTGKRRAAATVNRMRAQLAAIFRHARQEWGLSLESPTKSVPARKENNQRKVFLTEELAGKLMAAAQKSSWDKLYLLVLLGITTGARRGTLEAIRWSEVDFEARTASIAKTKNSDPIILTLPPDAVDELKKHRQLGDALVFARSGNPCRAFNSRKPWHEALRAVGLTPWERGMGPAEGFRFHDLRHASASFLAARGASLLAIGEVLGHRSSQTTKRYSHLLIGAKQKLTDEVFGDLLARTRSLP